MFVGLLGIMGLIAAPYADAEGQLITGGPFDHLWHMVTYASEPGQPERAAGDRLVSVAVAVDLKPIAYLRINPRCPATGLYAIHPFRRSSGWSARRFWLLAIPAVLFGVYRLLSRRRLGAVGATPAGLGRSLGDVQLALLGPAWFMGTWLPFELQSADRQPHELPLLHGVVMPGIYVAVTYLVSLGWRRRQTWLRVLVGVWAIAVVVAVILMYPFVAAF